MHDERSLFHFNLWSLLLKQRGSNCSVYRDQKDNVNDNDNGEHNIMSLLLYQLLQPATERVQALADISRSALCCHSNETRAPIANPPNGAQLEGIPYHSSN